MLMLKQARNKSNWTFARFCQPIIERTFFDGYYSTQTNQTCFILKEYHAPLQRRICHSKKFLLPPFAFHPLSLVFQLLFLPLSSSREIASKVFFFFSPLEKEGPPLFQGVGHFQKVHFARGGAAVWFMCEILHFELQLDKYSLGNLTAILCTSTLKGLLLFL